MEYGLIGEKLGHSFSPAIHGMFGNSEYVLKEIPREDIHTFMEQKKFRGINVTIPYKQDVMEHCVCDEVCLAIGSANTVVNRDGTLYAYNTDYLGFQYMTRRAGISFSGKKVVIFGSGGTAKTAVYAVKKAGAAKVILLSRRKESLIGVFPDCEVADYSQQEIFADAEVLVNTTPVGMYPKNGEIPAELTLFTRVEAIVDVIYNPMRTALLLEGMKRGITVTDGFPMLVAQAWYANCHFRGTESMPDAEERIEKVISALRRQLCSIALVGMPGSGKTTVGKILAEKLGRIFYDSDEVFLEKYGMAAGEYITAYGEAEFREKESEVIEELTARTGIVLSTGGGSVLREKNRTLLHQNGFVIYLDRPVNYLAREERPLSSGDDAIKRLFDERQPLYEETADLRIAVTEGNAEAAVDKIIDFWKAVSI